MHFVNSMFYARVTRTCKKKKMLESLPDSATSAWRKKHVTLPSNHRFNTKNVHSDILEGRKKITFENWFPVVILNLSLFRSQVTFKNDALLLREKFLVKPNQFRLSWARSSCIWVARQHASAKPGKLAINVSEFENFI